MPLPTLKNVALRMRFHGFPRANLMIKAGKSSIAVWEHLQISLHVFPVFFLPVIVILPVGFL